MSDAHENGLTVLTAERVRELRALALGRRLDGSAMEQLRQEYAALCDAWLAAQEREEWRPIETAPRDGTDILLGWSTGERTRYAHWLDNSGTKAPWKGWRAPSLESSLPAVPPTHWMPLPSSPTAVNSTTNFCPCCSGTQPGHLGYEPAAPNTREGEPT